MERPTTGRCISCDWPLDDHPSPPGNTYPPCGNPVRKPGDDDKCRTCGHYRAAHANSQCFVTNPTCVCKGFVQR